MYRPPGRCITTAQKYRMIFLTKYTFKKVWNSGSTEQAASRLSDKFQTNLNPTGTHPSGVSLAHTRSQQIIRYARPAAPR